MGMDTLISILYGHRCPFNEKTHVKTLTNAGSSNKYYLGNVILPVITLAKTKGNVIKNNYSPWSFSSKIFKCEFLRGQFHTSNKKKSSVNFITSVTYSTASVKLFIFKYLFMYFELILELHKVTKRARTAPIFPSAAFIFFNYVMELW